MLLHPSIYCSLGGGPFSLFFFFFNDWPTLPQIVDYLNQSSLHLTFEAVKVLPEKNSIHTRHSFDQLSSFRLSVHAVHHREQRRTPVYFPPLAVCLKNETINSSLSRVVVRCTVRRCFHCRPCPCHWPDLISCYQGKNKQTNKQKDSVVHLIHSSSVF